MALRRRGADASDDLFPELINILLEGWAAPIRPEHFGGADAFRIFELDDVELRERWRKHRSALLAEAARRGIEKPWEQQQFEKEMDQ